MPAGRPEQRAERDQPRERRQRARTRELALDAGLRLGAGQCAEQPFDDVLARAVGQDRRPGARRAARRRDEREQRAVGERGRELRVGVAPVARDAERRTAVARRHAHHCRPGCWPRRSGRSSCDAGDSRRPRGGGCCGDGSRLDTPRRPRRRRRARPPGPRPRRRRPARRRRRLAHPAGRARPAARPGADRRRRAARRASTSRCCSPRRARISSRALRAPLLDQACPRADRGPRARARDRRQALEGEALERVLAIAGERRAGDSRRRRGARRRQRRAAAGPRRRPAGRSTG